jgi:hypothetical protein
VTFCAKILRGIRVNPGTAAFDCAQKRVLGDHTRSIPAAWWFDTQVDVEIIEHSTLIPEVDGVITLLWVPEPAAITLGMTTIRYGSRAKNQSSN